MGCWPSSVRMAGRTKVSNPTKAPQGEPGRPMISVCRCRATVTPRPGLAATPRNRMSAPMAVMARAAKSCWPRPEAPRMTMMSLSSPRCNAAARLSRVSGTMPRSTLAQPNSWARSSRAYRLLHHFLAGCSAAPGGSSSSPGATSARRGRRTTSTVARPRANAVPMRCGVRRSPRGSTTVRRRISSPRRCTCTHLPKGCRTTKSLPSTWLSSIFKTTSAPGGMGAPVMMRTAWRGFSGCSRYSPAVSVAPSVRRAGRSRLALRVSRLRSA